MTARHILSRWERVRTVCRQFTQPLWLAALYVADNEHVTAPGLADLMKCSDCKAYQQLKQLRDLNLVEYTPPKKRADSANLTLAEYRANERLLHLLGVTMKEAQAA